MKHCICNQTKISLCDCLKAGCEAKTSPSCGTCDSDWIVGTVKTEEQVDMESFVGEEGIGDVGCISKEWRGIELDWSGDSSIKGKLLRKSLYSCSISNWKNIFNKLNIPKHKYLFIPKIQNFVTLFPKRISKKNLRNFPPLSFRCVRIV